MMLDKGNAFAGIQTVVEGMTPLLLYCTSFFWHIEGFELLLRRGASVRDRDPGGGTCLHCCLKLPASPFYSLRTRQMRDAIVYLIQQGADVFAEDSQGQSVSDFAYRRDKYPWDIDSVKGDIWDCALASCGHDITDFRRGRTRQDVYSRFYKREDFEDLWAGIEHLCPYYDLEDDVIYIPDEDPVDVYDDSTHSDSDFEDGGAPLGLGTGHFFSEE